MDPWSRPWHQTVPSHRVSSTFEFPCVLPGLDAARAPVYSWMQEVGCTRLGNGPLEPTLAPNRSLSPRVFDLRTPLRTPGVGRRARACVFVDAGGWKHRVGERTFGADLGTKPFAHDMCLPMPLCVVCTPYASTFLALLARSTPILTLVV